MSDKNQEIEFPVDWSYRIIVDASNEKFCDAVRDLLNEYGIESKLEKKEKSSSGKYQAYRLPIIFDSKELMEDLSARLAKVSGVKFLL